MSGDKNAEPAALTQINIRLQKRLKGQFLFPFSEAPLISFGRRNTHTEDVICEGRMNP